MATKKAYQKKPAVSSKAAKTLLTGGSGESGAATDLKGGGKGGGTKKPVKTPIKKSAKKPVKKKK